MAEFYKDKKFTENLSDDDRERFAELGVGSGVYARVYALVSPALPTGAQLSGQITVTTAGTAVQGPDVESPNGFFLKADPDNTDAVFVGNDGANDVTANNGFPLNTGETILVQVLNLNHLWFDADVSGEKICWLRA